MEDLTGKVIKSYEVQQLLGTGGFGAVYSAKQSVVDRDVAIKIIWPVFANHPDFIRRFETEAQVVAGLEHPHIVPLYDYWREPDGAYIVMRLLRGGHLKDEIRRGALPIEDCSRILGQVAAALTLAHRDGIVHRDIKPENILLDEDSNAYLADFGIAQILRNVQDGEDDMFSGMGSPAYASPEQISGNSTSTLSDIYSLGVILYEMIVGEHPFPQLAELTHTELLKLRTESRLPSLMLARPELSPGIDEVIQKATALHPTDRYPDMLSFARAFREATGMAQSRTATGTMVRTSLSDQEVVSNPYKGLRAFQESDVNRFYGRETLVRRLVSRLQEDETYNRFLAVVGPSGSGKSSVVHAGLIPSLKQGAIRGSEDWFYVDFVPGTEPFKELETALISIAADDIDNLMDLLLKNEFGLIGAINRALPDRASELLLFIDQFEEVFTLVEDPDMTEKFLDCIFTAVTQPESRLRLVITLRADFYDRPLMQPLTSSLMQDRTEVVVPLTTQELERCIVEPARRVGVFLDSGLVAAIITEVSEQPGALPLLQYSLSELFERREDNLITPKAYREIGGVRGALAKRADEIYREFNPMQQEAARQLFLRLITLGEGTEDTRRRALLSEVTSIARQEKVMLQVVDALGKSRLLTFDRDPFTRSPTVEVTHEAIIREWGRLRTWLDESRNEVRMQRSLSQLAGDWQDANRDPSFLLRGVRLEQYETWAGTTNIAMTEAETDFLQASIAERMRQETQEAQRVQWEEELEQRALNRLRLLVGVLLTAFVLTLGLLAFAFIQSQEAQRNASLSQSLALEASSRRALDENNSDLAITLAMYANEIDTPSTQAQRTLAEVALAPGTRRIFEGHTAWVSSVDISPDKQQVISSSTDFSVRLWDIASGALVYNLEGHRGDVESVAFSPDGTMAVSSAADFLAIVWDVENGTIIHELRGHERTVWDADFSPDGAQIVTGSTDTTVRLWDVVTGQQVRQFGCLQDAPTCDSADQSASVLTVAFTPDGTQIISGARDGRLLMWDRSTGALIHELQGHSTAVTDVTFSPDGAKIASGDGNGNIILWDAITGEQIDLFDVARGDDTLEVRGLRFFPNGRDLLVGVFDGSLQTWNTDTGELLNRLDEHTDSILGVAISHDGRLAVSGSKDETIRVWNVGSPGEIFDLPAHSERVTGIGFPLDVNTLVSGSADGTITLWDLQTGNPIYNFGMTEGRILSLDVNRETGQIITGGQDQGIIIWDAETGEQVNEITGFTEAVRSLTLSPDGSSLLIGGQNGLIEQRSLETGEVMQQFIGQDGPVFDLIYHPDGTRFFSAGDGGGSILVWDMNSGDIVQRLGGHSDIVYSISLSSDGAYLVSGSGDGNAIVWNLGDYSERFRLSEHTESVWSTAFSPDGTRILTGSSDGFTIIWDFETGGELQRFSSRDATIFEVAFAPTGDYAISGEDSGMLRVWHVFSLSSLRRWIEQNRYVRELTCAEAERFRITHIDCLPG